MRNGSCNRRLAKCLAVLACWFVSDGPPIFSQEIRDIFPLQAMHVHSSSMVELANGDLLACWYHGSGERRANDVVIQGACFRRNEKQWGPVFPMADTPGLPDCNPVLFVDKRRRVWMFWVVVVANRWENSVLKYRRASKIDEAGRPQWDWQDSIHLVPGDDFAKTLEAQFKSLDLREDLWAEYALPYSRLLMTAAKQPYKRQTGWMPRTHPITLPSGRILLPLYSDGFNVSLAAISDDNGKTWRSSKPMVGLGPIQPSIVPKANGQLVAYMRDSGGPPARVQSSVSSDQGETWSASVDTEIPNSGSSLEVIELKNRLWAMAYNDTEIGRHRLSLAISDDEGKTWKWKRTVEHDSKKESSYGYPSIVQTQDEKLHVTYSYAGPRGATIRHAVTEVDWIQEVSKVDH